MLISEDLFEQNLDFFQQINPALAHALSIHTPMSALEYDDDGEPDVLFEGMKLYGVGAKKHAAAQREVFWEKPGVATLSAFTVNSVDSEATKLREGIERYAKENAITFNEQRTTRHAFHLIILGVGLGQHIEALLKDVQPRNLVLVEPNFEFLYQSLFCFDWKGLVGPLIEDGAKVHILSDKNTSILISEVRRVYTEFGRANFDGITVYQHYENSLFDAVQSFIATEGDKLFSGLGFFEDEINMIANTYNNLKSGEERVFYASPDMRRDIPIFVVGSGPSLDASIEVIRENQHKAVIVSCGTALLPLLRGGVKPDFHVELERGKFQMEIPQTVSREFDIFDVCLVGSTTLVPGVKTIFPKRLYYFRHMLSSFPAFSGNIYNCLRFPSPTVGNTGVSFAQDIGFRHFYLFGLDLGFADPDAHHSVNSVYRELDGKHNFGSILWDQIVPGNFGGKVHSTNVLQWSRDTLEVSIDNSALGRRYFNCSDGALIKGTVPLLSEFVDLPEPVEPKKLLVERLIGRFPIYTQNDFQAHWKDGQIIQDVRRLGDRAIACIQDNSDLGTKKYISELMSFVKSASFDDAATSVLRGSLALFLVVGEHYLDRVEQYDKKAELEAYIRDAYCRLIDSMCNEVEVEFLSLEKTGALVNRETTWA